MRVIVQDSEVSSKVPIVNESDTLLSGNFPEDARKERVDPSLLLFGSSLADMTSL